MKIRVNSPTVGDKVVRVLSQAHVGVQRNKNEIIVDEGFDEKDVRIILQEKLDEEKFDFEDDFVLVNGNSIWSLKKIMKELEDIKKSGTTSQISGYFYKFMHLNFTIAHNNIAGWMSEHPSFDCVLHAMNTPIADWKSDVKKIVDTAINKYENKECTR
jgi:hypothetical protein